MRAVQLYSIQLNDFVIKNKTTIALCISIGQCADYKKWKHFLFIQTVPAHKLQLKIISTLANKKRHTAKTR